MELGLELNLENERKRRAELSAALLMAREAKTLEADAAARKAAAEKEKELQGKMNKLSKQRSELNMQLASQMEKANAEKSATDSRLAQSQKDQKAAMQKFQDEHEKLEKLEGERAQLIIILQQKKDNCKDLEGRIDALQASLDSTKTQSAAEKEKAEQEKQHPYFTKTTMNKMITEIIQGEIQGLDTIVTHSPW